MMSAINDTNRIEPRALYPFSPRYPQDVLSAETIRARSEARNNTAPEQVEVVREAERIVGEEEDVSTRPPLEAPDPPTTAQVLVSQSVASERYNAVEQKA